MEIPRHGPPAGSRGRGDHSGVAWRARDTRGRRLVGGHDAVATPRGIGVRHTRRAPSRISAGHAIGVEAGPDGPTLERLRVFVRGPRNCSGTGKGIVRGTIGARGDSDPGFTHPNSGTMSTLAINVERTAQNGVTSSVSARCPGPIPKKAPINVHTATQSGISPCRS